MGLKSRIPAHRVTPLFLLALCGAFLVSPATPAHAQNVQQVAATVNDDVISTYDLDQRVKLVLSSSGLQPSPDIMDKVRSQVLRSLVDERLELQEAAKFDVAISEDEILSSIKEIAKRNNVTVDSISQMLERAGVQEKTLHEQIRAEAAWNKLISQKYGSRIFISEEDINAELQRQMDNFNETQYLVSEIVLNVNDPSEEEDVHRTAMRLLEQMQRGSATFDAVAEQFSQAPSAAQGGDLGWLLPDDLDPEVAANLPKMLPGQVTAPIRTSTGYQILALRSKRRGSDGTPGKLISATLKQILIPVSQEHKASDVQAAHDKLMAVGGKLKGCSNVEAVAESAKIIYADLGKVAFDDIAPFFRSTVSILEPGEVSAPIESPVGVHIIVMCDREMTEGVKAKPPTREDIENRLWSQQVGEISKRYLRDLRRDSVVEYR